MSATCPKCGTEMAMDPPRQVWISFCQTCGQPDYAYSEKPDEAGAECPKCGTSRGDMAIVGPYTLASVRARGKKS